MAVDLDHLLPDEVSALVNRIRASMAGCISWMVVPGCRHRAARKYADDSGLKRRLLRAQTAACEQDQRKGEGAES